MLRRSHNRERRLKMNKHLRSYFPDYLTAGAIFSKMPQAPWMELQAGLEMDIAYLSSYSGIKPASDMISELSVDGVLDQQKLADVLWSLYGRNWKRLWDAFMTDYDPITNYDVLETVNRQAKTDRTIDRDIDKSGTVDTTDTETTDTNNTENTTMDETATTEYGKNVDTTGHTVRKDDETSTTEYGKTVNTTGKTVTDEDETTTTKYGKNTKVDAETDTFVYGFNSAVEVPTNIVKETSTEAQSGSDVVTRALDSTVDETGKETQSGQDVVNRVLNSIVDETGKEAQTGTDTTTKKSTGSLTGKGNISSTETVNTRTGEKTADDTTDNQNETEEIIRSRKGNIGQNTYQELLRQEFDLWKWNFYLQVFMDCDKFITLSVFGSLCDHI